MLWGSWNIQNLRNFQIERPKIIFQSFEWKIEKSALKRKFSRGRSNVPIVLLRKAYSLFIRVIQYDSY